MKTDLLRTTKNDFTKKQMEARKSKGMSTAKDYPMLAATGLPSKDQKIRLWTSSDGINHTQEFISYGCLIAIRYQGRVTLNFNKWDISRTSVKYLCSFLGQTYKQIKQAVTNGTYKLLDLN